MTDISGISGSGRIMEILHQLGADPGALNATGAAWNSSGSAATSTANTVAANTSTLDGAWDGPGADAVVGYTAQLRTALDAVEPATRRVSAAIQGASEALTVAKSAVEAVTERVAAAVAALPAPLGDYAGQKQHEAQVAAIVGPATGEAETAMSSAVNALRAAAGAITATCGASPLHTLPPIGEQAFQPAQFSPQSWQIHPVPDVKVASSTDAQRPSNFAPQASADRGDGGVSGGGVSGGGVSGGGVSGGGVSGGDLGGGPPGGGGQAAPAQVQQWIDEAIEILRQQGYPVDKMDRDAIWAIIEHESGGNPQAINNWDSNAAKGTPSKGLMQTIGPTFASNALPGHGDIWNPVDNIIAGVRYSISRYGSVSNVPGVVGLRSGGGYRGY